VEGAPGGRPRRIFLSAWEIPCLDPPPPAQAWDSEAREPTPAVAEEVAQSTAWEIHGCCQK
jgi:hypothetical protein